MHLWPSQFCIDAACHTFFISLAYANPEAIYMTMKATVLQVQNNALLVCDQSNGQEVLVHTSQARCFCPGDRICIQYNGVMTLSIPPQISAESICKIC